MRSVNRRRLVAALALLGAGPALAQYHAAPPVRVYVVPLADFPEYLAGNIAKQLQRELGFPVSASLRLAPFNVETLPDTGQLVGEDLVQRAVAASARLPGLTPTTYRVFLTMRDLNAQSGGFRFQFSMHLPGLNSSVVSMARLLEEGASRYYPTERAAVRMFKMVKRAVGELHLGWQRSTDPADLMYAPLMSVVDLDGIGTEHRRQDSETTAAASRTGSAASHQVQ